MKTHLHKYMQIWAIQHLDMKTSSTIPLIWIPKKISLSNVEIEKIQESFPAGDTLVDPQQNPISLFQ